MTQDTKRPRVGVLAIQGNFAAHAEALTEAGADPVEIRNPEELSGLDGLIIPGGESTTMLKFLERRHFFDVLKEFVHGTPTFGTISTSGLYQAPATVPTPATFNVSAVSRFLCR